MSEPTPPLPHDAHVTVARKIFRDCGFELSAMAFRRPPAALVALKQFNGLGPDASVPFAWNYHPNAWCRDRWLETGRLV